MSYGSSEMHMTHAQREALIQRYLGETVTVVIDRPIGYVHHTKGGIVLHYTCNYGYLPGVPGGDGEEQDVYVLGVEEPVETFTGKIIAAVRRRDDNEDKLVAAPEGVRLHQGQIAEAIEFVEQYFDSTVTPVFHRSCGVIPVRKNGDRVEILVLQQRSGAWSVPKGHMEAHESEEDTARRELREEIGLTARLLPGFRHLVHYPVSPVANKELVLFAGTVQGTLRPQAAEIKGCRWVEPAQARTLLRPEYRAALTALEEFLGQNPLV
ncbi:MAG: NUDIX domain-containing protein [Eubacteriales bacterium]|nr:NUDIX domain-containing protein [Eubacteriales bacterium]